MTQGDFIAHTVSLSIVQNSAQSSQPKKPIRIIEAPIHTFEGRHDLLEKIHEKLQQCLARDHFMRRIVALTAMGGMGKTETARKFAHQYRKVYENVVWIDSETESSAKESFTNIAKTLHIPYSNDADGKEVAERVHEHISAHFLQSCLLIFDNANQLKSDENVFGIWDYLPAKVTENLPLILLTSQTTEWRRCQCEVIDVTELNEEESMNFLISRFQLSSQAVEDDSGLRDLLQSLNTKLNGYPLALGLAAANIPFIPGQDTSEFLKKSLGKYIHSVDNNTILKQRANTHLATNYQKTLLKVWDIAMTNLQRRENGREAKLLLRILAYFSQKDLKYGSYDTVNKVYSKGRSEVFGITFPGANDASFDDAFRELQTLGLATAKDKNPDIVNKNIKVHRLIQILARQDDPMNFGIQKILIYFMSLSGFKDYGSETISEWEGYSPSKEGLPSWAVENE